MFDRHLLITGRPGVGKTTLIKDSVEFARGLGLSVYGFYTEEIRREGQRVGFLIKVLPRGKSGRLAGLGKGPDGTFQPYGRYKVYVNHFEELVIENLERAQKKADLIAIDEIGGMELLSKKFGQTVKRLLRSKTVPVLATIQLKKVHLVEKWDITDNVRLLELHETTRRRVKMEVRDWIAAIAGRRRFR